MSLLQTLDIYPHQMVNVGNYGGNFDKNWNICELTGLVFFFFLNENLCHSLQNIVQKHLIYQESDKNQANFGYSNCPWILATEW